MAIAKTTSIACRALERGYKVCDDWAARRGMKFNPDKSELIHFTRARRPRTERVAILGEGSPGLAPVDSARFLGVYLDRKLTFKAHLKVVKNKMARQTLALTRLAGKTWGVRLTRARDIYTKVIVTTATPR